MVVERHCNLWLLLAASFFLSCMSHAIHMQNQCTRELITHHLSICSFYLSVCNPFLSLIALYCFVSLLPCYIIMSLSSIYAEPSRYHHRRNIGTCTLHSSSSDRRQNGGPENICQNWWDPKTCLEHCAIYTYIAYIALLREWTVAS